MVQSTNRCTNTNMVNCMSFLHKRSDTLYFWDGVRKIDIVLAYLEEDENDEIGFQHSEIRKTFERNLRNEGLELELEPFQRSADGKTNFLKIYATEEALQKYADIMNIQTPIKKFTSIFYSTDSNLDSDDESSSIWSFWSPFDNDPMIIPPEPNFFNAGVYFSSEDRFILKDRESEFNSAQRSMIVWQILNRTRYSLEDEYKKGIYKLLSKKVYEAAYPLHDGHYDRPRKDGHISNRRILYTEWASWRKWYKKQPLWMIKNYFGEKVGLYFAWLGFYTTMLIPPSIVGVFVLIFGIFTIDAEWNYPSKDICYEEGIKNLTMCPQCPYHCPFWELSESCSISKLTHAFDNSSTVFFSIFMSLWATIFLELWKRRQSIIVWEWDLSNYEDIETIRPEFEASIKTTRINPVSKKHEPYLPPHSKAIRVAFTTSFIIFMLLLVLTTVFSIMIYRVTVTVLLNESISEQQNAAVTHSQVKLFVALTAGCLNLLSIVFLNYIYEFVALWLTNVEQPRTYTDFEHSYTFKLFMFQCINFYSSLVYIAFFKGKFFSHPGDFSKEEKSTMTQFAFDLCDPAGCFYELFIQLAIIMVGKQAMNNIIEFILPKVIIMWKRYVYRTNIVDNESSNNEITRWEMDYSLKSVDRITLLDEYLEMVIQYGFVTLFVAAFPLAPLFALINNVVEIRLDANKYVTSMRRPLSQRTESIGAWQEILQAITYISVIFNGITIALASDFIPRMVYSYVHSEDSTLRGYVKYTLTEFNTSVWGNQTFTDWPGPKSLKEKDLPATCYFKALREPPDYRLSRIFFHVFSARLAFVLVFEHFVFGIIGLMRVMIPDVPQDIKVQTQREEILNSELLLESPNKTNPHKHYRDNGNEEEDLKYVIHQTRKDSVVGKTLSPREMLRKNRDSHVEPGGTLDIFQLL
ncbi:anoctamin-5 isoform X2 [Lepeophtheirus salmonis]|uniref:anoctamin-5 isoform X2 n=1 Tax=Lepeophtheirus salmonis TaxID=72036 RepID=UPI001AE1C938|nr:anoctamin-5-like isoform X1 [Lepeophtheirus salmonis]